MGPLIDHIILMCSLRYFPVMITVDNIFILHKRCTPVRTYRFWVCCMKIAEFRLSVKEYMLKVTENFMQKYFHVVSKKLQFSSLYVFAAPCTVLMFWFIGGTSVRLIVYYLYVELLIN